MKQTLAKRRKATRRFAGSTWILAVAMCLLLGSTPNLLAREKNAIQYGAGLIVNVPLPENEVLQAVQDVAQNGIIRGTKEYNKDEFITGATAETFSRAFPAWTEGGKVFYKQRLHAIDPRNFKDGSDVGTLTIRYVVQGLEEKSTVLRIDAIFVEDFRHNTHLSNGSIESAEYKDIHDHIEAAELMKQQAAEAEQAKLRRSRPKAAAAEQTWSSSLNPSPEVQRQTSTNATESLTATETPQPVTPVTEAPPSGGALPENDSAEAESLEKRVQDLRQQVERIVKAPGAPLKSAPFQTASTLKSLSSGTEVLIVISTPYWYGVETHDGQHGWISRAELEQLP